MAENEIEDLDAPGNLARFSGDADDVVPLGTVTKRTSDDPEALKKQREASRALAEARKSA